MPLRCLDDVGASLHAFAIPAVDWPAVVADNQQRRHLRMPCCQAAVALKTSTLGLRFFAHVSRGGCATGDESREHLMLKQLAVDAARARGWHAETEVAGDGWRADVLATRGRHRVAVEVQWSPQSDAETLRRQAQYAAAGVRALWLFRQRGFPSSPDVPAVRIAGSWAKGFTALAVPVATVLDAVFDRRFRFGIPAGSTARLRVVGAVEHCWADDCDAVTRVVSHVDVVLGDTACRFTLAQLEHGSALLRAVLAALPAAQMIGRIRSRTTRQGVSYIANACVRCDRMFGERRTPANPGSVQDFAGFALAVTAEIAAVIAAQPAYKPSWSITAPQPNNAFVSA